LQHLVLLPDLAFKQCAHRTLIRKSLRVAEILRAWLNTVRFDRLMGDWKSPKLQLIRVQCFFYRISQSRHAGRCDRHSCRHHDCDGELAFWKLSNQPSLGYARGNELYLRAGQRNADDHEEEVELIDSVDRRSLGICTPVYTSRVGYVSTT
jgi:hypothetical protein